MIHVYFGDGKGKTTAALGLLVRACGCGMECVMVQFLKDWKCGELETLCGMQNVTVLRGKADGASFSINMTEEELAKTRAIHNENLKKAIELCAKGGLLVLDELLDAVSLGLIDDSLVRGLLDAPPAGLEIAITGHGAVDWIMERADYITEMVKRRHPYDTGVQARRGIEF